MRTRRIMGSSVWQERKAWAVPGDFLHSLLMDIPWLSSIMMIFLNIIFECFFIFHAQKEQWSYVTCDYYVIYYITIVC